MMRIRNLYFLLSGILLFAATACDDKANDWGVDESHDRLFRPTAFTTSALRPTSIELRYFGVMDATRYMFEFSEGDSLQFNNIVKTVEILADTLTPYSEEATLVETEYRTRFEDLKGTTRYSVRMKAVSTTKNMESGYSQLYFVTPNEQIFTGATPALDKVTLSWIAGSAVTHIGYRTSLINEETIRQLSSQEMAEGRAGITDLLPGASYQAVIYNNDARRGEITFRTLGIPASEGGTYLMLLPEVAGDIGAILTDMLAEGKKNIVLVCEGDGVYAFGNMTIPAGIERLDFVGNVDPGEALPELQLPKLILSGAMSSISFQQIDFNAQLNNNAIELNTATNFFKTIDFEGCTIRDVGRSLVSITNASVDVDAVRFNNCLIHNVGVGGYGFVRSSTAVVKIGLIAITNSTVTEIGSDRLFELNGGVQQVTLDKITLYNNTSKSKHIFRFNAAPGAVTVSNSIFAGPNGGDKINSGNSNYAYLEFYGCFMTSDMVENTIPFVNITKLSMTSDEMFADPRNGDFHLKAGVKYAGEGKAGDPRWW
jgi:hypothetical protein